MNANETTGFWVPTQEHIDALRSVCDGAAPMPYEWELLDELLQGLEANKTIKETDPVRWMSGTVDATTSPKGLLFQTHDWARCLSGLRTGQHVRVLMIPEPWAGNQTR